MGLPAGKKNSFPDWFHNEESRRDVCRKTDDIMKAHTILSNGNENALSFEL